MGEAGGAQLPAGPGVRPTEVDRSLGAEVLLSTAGAVGCPAPRGMPRREKTLVPPPRLPPTQEAQGFHVPDLQQEVGGNRRVERAGNGGRLEVREKGEALLSR